MASNILSRFLPPVTSPSIYETLGRDDSSDSDVEARAGTNFENDNLGGGDYNIDTAMNDAMEGSIRLGGAPQHQDTNTFPSAPVRPVRHQRTPHSFESDEADDDVPASLLIESDMAGNPASLGFPTRGPKTKHKSPAAISQGHGAEQRNWRTAQQHQKLHRESDSKSTRTERSGNGLVIDPKERAMWRWVNVQNLDNFLQSVYRYYQGKGIYSIILYNVLKLLTLVFTITFALFLTTCIKWSNLRNSTEMSDIYVSQCSKRLSGFTYFLIWIFAFWWIGQLFTCIKSIRDLKHLHDFYHYLLDIPDIDIQTVSWQDVVKRLMALRDANASTATNFTDRHRRWMDGQSKKRMDAHDIANRVMRKENYMIAIINKGLLDISLPVPVLGNRPIMSNTLQWNIDLCILDFMFDHRGQVKREFLKSSSRKALSDALRGRFQLLGFVNIVIAPFMLFYVLISFFLQNFSEYQKDPGAISFRQYTSHARWKFREFNELQHLFDRRMNMSYPFASRYINQFPKDKMVQLARFVGFIAGSLVGVLGVVSLFDPDLFLGFEITPDRTVLFYLGILTTIWATARGSVPEDFLVFDPEHALNAVINFTHYAPASWDGRMHTDDVRKEFVQMYKLKLVIFVEEVLSILTTPFVMMFSLPHRSEQIVDFIREFTVDVSGLGLICSHALFDFEKGGNAQKQPPKPATQGVGLREDYYATKDNKMLASYYNFLDHYVTNPHQRPGQAYHPNQQGGKQLNPPPAFTGMIASQIDGASNGIGRHDQGERLSMKTSRFNTSGGIASRGTPRFAAAGVPQSPMASILLDPQHQPPALPTSVHRPSRLRTSRRPVTDVMEDEEDELNNEQNRSGPLNDSDRDLGESWLIKAGRAGDSDEDEGIDAGNGQGVLGLVYQLSKAQTGAGL